MKDIVDFRIGTAFYILKNSKGAKLRLNLDYSQNTFNFEILKKGTNLEKLKKQAEVVAKSMLGKKAKRNLAYKLLELEVS